MAFMFGSLEITYVMYGNLFRFVFRFHVWNWLEIFVYVWIRITLTLLSVFLSCELSWFLVWNCFVSFPNI